jgi:phosphohistidine phosphatase
MDLILWRHAEAEDIAANDLARQLTGRGRKDARAVAQWLRTRLPAETVILASPAARTVQTVEALTDQYRVIRELAPGGSVEDILQAAGWPAGIAPCVLVVGHQPTLGAVAARLLHSNSGWSLKKGALVWLSARERDGMAQTVPRALISPDLL